MPSAADIYASIQPAQSPAGPVDNYATLLKLKSLAGASDLQDLQRTKATRDLQEEEQFRSLFSNATPEQMSAPDFLQRAMAASPTRGMALQKTQLETQKAQAELFKTKLETGAKALELHRDQLTNVNTPQEAAQWVKSAYEDPTLKAIAEHGGTLEQALARIPTDPAQFADWKRNSSAGAAKLLELNQQLSGQQETARHNKATESEAGARLTETKRHNAAIEGDPTVEEQTAQGIAKGELAPLSGFALSKPQGQRIMARVTQIAQENGKPYDPTQFSTRQKAEKDFATGKNGNTVRSFNVALSHLDTLQGAADALNNGNVKLFNKIGNELASQTGGSAPTDFNAVKKIVADEIVKAIVGSGGGVSDREEAAKSISAANSPEQLAGVIKRYKELMRGQINGLRQQYETTTGKKDFDKFLSESGKKNEHGGSSADAPGAANAGIKFLGFE